MDRLVIVSESGEVPPPCRTCILIGSGEKKRAPNVATYATTYVDGLSSLTCTMHAKMAAKAGGFAMPLPSSGVLHGPGEVATVRAQLMTGAYALLPPVRDEVKALPTAGVTALYVEIPPEGVTITRATSTSS